MTKDHHMAPPPINFLNTNDHVIAMHQPQRRTSHTPNHLLHSRAIEMNLAVLSHKLYRDLSLVHRCQITSRA